MIESLLGSLCVLCLQRLGGHHRRWQLCAHCLAGLPWNTDPEPAEPLGPISRQITPLVYQDIAAALVLKAKHHSGLVEARVFGALLASAVSEFYSGLDPDLSPHLSPHRRPDIIVPVPLSFRRLLARGHNQAALIAKPVSKALSIRMQQRLVKRVRHTIIQPGLNPKDRLENLRQAFHCTDRLHGEVVAIIDDVVTSGATAITLGECLLAAGASEIHLWCPTRSQPTATLNPSISGQPDAAHRNSVRRSLSRPDT